MCGIFGVVFGKDPNISSDFAGQVMEKLYRFSQTRGSEAAGLTVFNGETIDVLKQAGSVDHFLAAPKFNELMQRAKTLFERNKSGASPIGLAMTGHTRLVTNGFQSNEDNNQPVIANGTVGIHNGIIVNDAELWNQFRSFTKRSDVDTEVLVNILRKHFDDKGDIAWATQQSYREIKGAASIAFVFDKLDDLLLSTNTGSLHYLTNEKRTFLAFASERFILQSLCDRLDLASAVGPVKIEQLPAFRAMLVNLRDLSMQPFACVPKNGEATPAVTAHPRAKPLSIVLHTKNPNDQQRCTQCLLPASYPFVKFDASGVCKYCRNWKKIAPKGRRALEELVDPYRSKDGKPDVIVAFSGGRDSSYGLHYVKTELKMNPVAFTYDWGMVTDLARRNQARICGKLGVEHIVRSANIQAKRRYIRKNIEAWLKKPELGMVTLFTAGDKEFYSHARQLRKETGIQLVIFSTGNMIEDTPYKTGLCGIDEDDHGMTLTGLSFRNEMALLWYYARNYITNPAYINESIWDTFYAYWSTFVVKDDFLYLFHYLPWVEEEIVGTIRREYDWEVATDTKSTWRIGDGSAAFYNYIYTTICGWTEDEVMLSNRVREGHITLREARALAEEYSKPRFPSIREYSQLVGFNCEEALTIINGQPKMY
jgi:glutamine---fructose-6-phosphate transaminase (isomerizing)